MSAREGNLVLKYLVEGNIEFRGKTKLTISLEKNTLNVLLYSDEIKISDEKLLIHFVFKVIL
jgi:hypothetical protein